MDLKFYFCRHCGKVIVVTKESGTPTICCGEEMKILEPFIKDGPAEKHIPIIKLCNDLVKVYIGAVEHPSVKNHYIEWILIQTNKGIQKKQIGPEVKPMAQFRLLPCEKLLSAYTYCNQHRLWKSSVVENVEKCAQIELPQKEML